MTMAPRRRSETLPLFVAAMFALVTIATPTASLAHNKKHHHAASTQVRPEPPAANNQPGATPSAETSAAMQGPSLTAVHSGMGEMMDDMDADRSKMSFTARLLDWFGRLHPIIVHFPIAFFPAALFTAVVGRRRPGFAAPVQFLVVAGGIIAPIAAILGWLDAASADPGQLLTVHRWLGSAIGAGALALAIFAWRRPGQDRGGVMIAALALITGAIVVQGWYGGAMVHGIDHMTW